MLYYYVKEAHVVSQTHTRRTAHLEYENGFLIFDRPGAYKEVWRLESIYEDIRAPDVFRPDDRQMEAWKTASQNFPTANHRGHFRPWALINTQDLTRAYRFVYPDLLVCGLRKAYVWDVRTAVLSLEVDGVQGARIGDINYVELSMSHVFVCSTNALRVFSRRNGAFVLEIPSYQLAYSDVRLAVQLDPARKQHYSAGPAHIVPLPAEPTLSTSLYTASYAEFSAGEEDFLFYAVAGS